MEIKVEKWFGDTPNPRELTDEEIDEHHLRYHNGTEMMPAIETSTHIWAAASTTTNTIYRLYNGGTNRLVILRYSWEKDKWERIEVEEIKNIHGLLWLLCIKIDGLKYKFKTESK